MISTQIEIARSPEQVRSVFFDFEKYPQWTQGFIKSIAPANAESAKLEKGDRLNCALQGMNVSPIIMENTEREFRWRGVALGIPGLFVGEHSFRFEPSQITPGSTTFVQSEKFSGILSFLIAPGTSFGKSTTLGFEGFNRDIKTRAESLD